MIKRSEQQEAEDFAKWLKGRGYDFTHVPNETGSSAEAKRRAIRMKRAGVSKGFPDYLIFAKGKMIAIELKSLTGSATKEQKQWLDTLKLIGFHTAVCKGSEAAKQFVRLVVNQNIKLDLTPHYKPRKLKDIF
jgi:hypothetical protein